MKINLEIGNLIELERIDGIVTEFDEARYFVDKDEWNNHTDTELLLITVIKPNLDIYKLQYYKHRFIEMCQQLISNGNLTVGSITASDLANTDITFKEQLENAGIKVESIKENDVYKPNYYKAGNMDVISFCQYHELGFDIGNVIKYVTRAGKKDEDKELEDLNKALEYLQRRIQFVENKKEGK